MSRPVLVTGAAGFIGSAVAERLLADGISVIGVDNLNDYYDPKLKPVSLDSKVKVKQKTGNLIVQMSLINLLWIIYFLINREL